ncbi:MAG: HlyC/CorC family transporter [Erysipelotrichia bacterium]|nr:HlyC/CorC family transporter [Erysipelotrichia bacterium]
MEVDQDGLHIFAQLFLLLVLTAVNAFFACAEMAIVSLNKNRIRILAEEGNKKAIKIEKVLEEPTKFLSTIQVAITLAGFFASASAATGISKVLGSYLEGFNIAYAQTIAMVMITIILSYFTLVFGELVPKRIALQKAESISMFSINTINFVSQIASPFIKILSLSTNLVLRLLGMKNEGLEEQVSEEEIRSLIEVGQERGVFKKSQKDMITSMFEFDDIIVREVMCARTNVFAIDVNAKQSEYMEQLLTKKYARVPVYEGNIDHIIGVLYMRDFILEAYRKGFDHISIRTLLHEPFFVPETKKIDELFYELQIKKKYMAIVIDEYGGFSGIATIEDLVEEVMGEIEDEYDEGEPKIEKIDNRHYLVNGLFTINDLNDDLGLQLHSNTSDTISGLLIEKLGYIPSENDNSTIIIDDVSFKVLKVKDKCIWEAELEINENQSDKKES